MAICESNPSFEAQVSVEFEWQESQTDKGTALFAGIEGVLHATIMPNDYRSFDVVVGRAHYGLNLLMMCSDIDKSKREAARMASQLLADMCAEANGARDKPRSDS